MKHRTTKTNSMGTLCFGLLTLLSVFGAPTTFADDQLPLNHLLRGRVVDKDGDPVRDAKITTLSVVAAEKPITATTGASGAFAMKVHANGIYGPGFTVTSADGKFASYVSRFSYTTDERKPFNIVLGPWKETVVKVVDQAGIAVAKAEVSLQCDYTAFHRETTNENGIATLRYPADTKVDLINALKADVGYDYYENYDSYPTQGRLNVPDEIELTLSGAKTITVTVVDDQENPIADTYVAPWIITLPEKIASANVGGTLFKKTGKDGVASFPWLPKSINRVTFLVNAKGYSSAQRTKFTGKEHDLTAHLQSNPVVTGKVTFPDGTPAAGIHLQGEGRGVGDYFRGHATTKDDGTYEIAIYPNQKTIIAITDERYAATSKTDINLAPGKKANADFTLFDGTLIRGHLTVGPDKSPLAGETATLIQEDGNANLVRWSKSDPDGDYVFRVGPGNYTLSLPGKKQMQLTVKNEADIVKDSHIDRKERDVLQGVVRSGKGKPVPDAAILAETINDRNGHAGFKAKSTSDGTYRTERWTDEMAVFVISEKTQAAIIQTIKPADKAMDFILEPAAVVQGIIVDQNDAPVAGVRVQVTMSGMKGHVYFFTSTDKDGMYKFTCPVGASCETYAVVADDHREIGTLEIEKPEPYKFETHKLQSAK